MHEIDVPVTTGITGKRLRDEEVTNIKLLKGYYIKIVREVEIPKFTWEGYSGTVAIRPSVDSPDEFVSISPPVTSEGKVVEEGARLKYLDDTTDFLFSRNYYLTLIQSVSEGAIWKILGFFAGILGPWDNFNNYYVYTALITIAIGLWPEYKKRKSLTGSLSYLFVTQLIYLLLAAVVFNLCRMAEFSIANSDIKLRNGILFIFAIVNFLSVMKFVKVYEILVPEFLTSIEKFFKKSK